MKKFFYIILALSMFKASSAMKVEFQYDDWEEESHSGVYVTLEKKDINPNIPSMESNYNRLGAAILKGASVNHVRYIHIKNITTDRVNFARALMLKAYEIATNREVPITMSFFDATGANLESLTSEWSKYQPEISKFFENPYDRILSEDYDSDYD